MSNKPLPPKPGAVKPQTTLEKLAEKLAMDTMLDGQPGDRWTAESWRDMSRTELEAATFRALVASGLLGQKTSANLRGVARGIFFKALTFETVFERAALPAGEAARLLELAQRLRVDLKRQDAHLLVARMKELAAQRSLEGVAWVMSEPLVWRRYIGRLRGVN